jgi:hypothetical protein
VRAKNGLDVNYIPRAEQHGAEVRPLHLVRLIEPRGGAYRVVFDRLESGRMIPGEETAARVILAAGSLGSTGAAPALPRRIPDASGDQPAARHGLESQRNFISFGT